MAALILLVVFVVKFWWLLSAVLATGTASALIGKWLAARDDRAIARRRRDAALCARADRQHAAVLAGNDVVGMFGDYPPSVFVSVDRSAY
jgi:hypothetical protein